MTPARPICNDCGDLMTLLDDFTTQDGHKIKRAYCEPCGLVTTWADYPQDLHHKFREILPWQRAPQIKMKVA